MGDEAKNEIGTSLSRRGAVSVSMCEPQREAPSVLSRHRKRRKELDFFPFCSFSCESFFTDESERCPELKPGLPRELVNVRWMNQACI